MALPHGMTGVKPNGSGGPKLSRWNEASPQRPASFSHWGQTKCESRQLDDVGRASLIIIELQNWQREEERRRQQVWRFRCERAAKSWV